jgi:nicotinamidase-related amidase
MRLSAGTSMLCVIDVQERLVPAMSDGVTAVSRCRRLAEAAGLLGVPIVATEQYRKGLGATVPELAPLLPPPLEKLSFSCCGADGFLAAIPAGVGQLVLCGLETHVCVAQTALDLLAAGYAVFLGVDAITSRHACDRDIALRRLEAAGAVPTTSEAILFEWCRSASHPQFQAIRKLVV